MIETTNNDYDLDIITITDPFVIGDTKVADRFDRRWLAHWRDETTLTIAPDYAPDAWRPAHIYKRGGGDGFSIFTLEPPRTDDAA
jgi:hypothetical protein